jgi:hypothetical protein
MMFDEFCGTKHPGFPFPPRPYRIDSTILVNPAILTGPATQAGALLPAVQRTRSL